jgi:hypothetical protein
VKRTPPNYARPCRSKLHTIPAGVMGCRECNKLSNRKPRTNGHGTNKGIPKPSRALLGALPPDDVLVDAACSPATASLFDPVGYRGEGEPPGNDWDGVTRAQAICAGCPVRRLCYADAIKAHRFGVWGGTYLSPKWYERRRSETVVQNVKSPVEYPT